MDEKIHTVECPNCGAPLDVPDDGERFFKCQFCGTTLEDEASTDEHDTGVYKIKIISPPGEIAPAKVQSQPNRVLYIVLGFILLITCFTFAVASIPGLLTMGFTKSVVEEIGGEKAVEIIDPSGLGGLRIWSFDRVRLLPAGDQLQPDLVGIASFSDETDRLLYLDFESDPVLQWFGIPLEEGAELYKSVLISDDRNLYLAYSKKLAAYKRSTGEIIWQTTLSDEIESVCKDCLQVFGNQLVVLTADGSLQALETQTGAPAWIIHLQTTPRQLIDFAGHLAVLDEQEGTVGLNVYDPASGDLLQRVVPQCPNEPFPDDLQTPGVYDPVLVAPDHQSVYFSMGFFEPGCIQRWDDGTTSPAWQTTFPVEAIRTIDEENWLFTGEKLIFTNHGNLYTVDLTGGEFSGGVLSEGYEFFPLMARDGTLILQADRTRGSHRTELWGVNGETGEQEWTYLPEAEDPIEDHSTAVSDSGVWEAGLKSKGVTVLQIFSDPYRITLDPLNLQDGASSGQKILQLPDSTGPWFEIVSWQGDQVWLVIGGRIAILDVNTATEIASWPPQ